MMNKINAIVVCRTVSTKKGLWKQGERLWHSKVDTENESEGISCMVFKSYNVIMIDYNICTLYLLNVWFI